jgi:hypothetical protein
LAVKRQQIWFESDVRKIKKKMMVGRIKILWSVYGVKMSAQYYLHTKFMSFGFGAVKMLR